MSGITISQLPSASGVTGNELIELSTLSPTVTITATTISANAADNSFNDTASGFIAAGFASGDRINVQGASNAPNNIFTGVIASCTSGKIIISSPEGDAIVSEAMGSTITISKWISVKAPLQVAREAPLTPPKIEDFNIVLNSPTVSEIDGSLRMLSATGTPILRAVLRNLPVGNFSVRIRFRARRGANFNGCGLFFRDTAGKYACPQAVYNSGVVAVIDHFSSATNFNSSVNPSFSFGLGETPPEWLRADFDAVTNDITAYWSWDGINWESMGTSTYLGTCDAFGIGTPVNNSSLPCLAYFDHFEIIQ